MAGKDKAAGAADKGLKVTSRPASFRRAGHTFTAEARVIPLDQLTEAQVELIENDPNLVSHRVDTKLNAAWFNDLQEELMAIIEGVGLTPTAGVRTQVAQAIQFGNLSVAASAGTANAITLAFTPTATAFGKGPVWWRATAANDSTTPTVQRDGLTAKTLVKGANGALVPGDIPGAGAWLCSIYDAVLDKEVLINPAKGVASSGVGFVGQLVFGAINDAPPNTMLADGALVSCTAYATLFAALVKTSVVTITLATPGVINWTAHGRKANDPVKFGTTGTLPTGYVAGTTYYVVGGSINPNNFTLSATPGGAAIAAVGPQSGVHTAIYAPHGYTYGATSFNLPDRRSVFPRGWDAGRGADANRPFGSYQADAMQGHLHSGATWPAHQYPATGSASAMSLVSITTINSGPAVSDGTNGTPRIATETRPVNNADAIFIIYQV